MARISGPARPGLYARLAYWFTRRKLGRVVEPVKIMAHHSRVLGAVAGFEMKFARANLVDPRVKELAQIEAARQIGCPF
jgi:hypothetical protein